MPRNPGLAYARCLNVLASLASKIQAIRSPVYPLLEQHFNLTGCMLETEPFDPPSNTPPAGIEGDSLPWTSGDRAQASWVLPKKNRIQFTHVGLDVTEPAILDLGATCLVTGASCMRFVLVSFIAYGFLFSFSFFPKISVEWTTESMVQTSGTLQLEAADSPTSSHWPVGNAKMEITSSKKVIFFFFVFVFPPFSSPSFPIAWSQEDGNHHSKDRYCLSLSLPASEFAHSRW